jgi:hypothetical protein
MAGSRRVRPKEFRRIPRVPTGLAIQPLGVAPHRRTRIPITSRPDCGKWCLRPDLRMRLWASVRVLRTTRLVICGVTSDPR